ncbi:MAG: hypothetical protein OXU61_12580 [Gammaproteobacteria bacterium]|nr:hypothetical protein [Gammaproteobacteria bacterium]
MRSPPREGSGANVRSGEPQSLRRRPGVPRQRGGRLGLLWDKDTRLTDAG